MVTPSFYCVQTLVAVELEGQLPVRLRMVRRDASDKVAELMQVG